MQDVSRSDSPPPFTLTPSTPAPTSMTVAVTIGDQRYRANLQEPIDISIAPTVEGSKRGVRAFGIPGVRGTPFVSGRFNGLVQEGASCNCCNINIFPHGTGTHIEGLAHLTSTQSFNWGKFSQAHFVAELITVAPTKVKKGTKFSKAGDALITRESVERALKDKAIPEVLVIRTLPNNTDKQNRDYTGTNPPYLSVEAAQYLVSLGIQHLVVDLPSLDREVSRVPAHRIFFGYKIGQNGECVDVDRMDATITEFAYIPSKVKDGTYLLNHQVASLPSDAVVTRPTLYALTLLNPIEVCDLSPFRGISKFDDRAGAFGRRHAQALDAQDPLAHFRERFELPKGLLYLDGNSLGAMPKDAAALVERLTTQWSQQLIRGWNTGWFTLPQKVGALVAPIVGAKPSEIIACDSVSVNLIKVVTASLKYQYEKNPKRINIVTVAGNFPTDLDGLESALAIAGHGGRLIRVKSNSKRPISPAQLAPYLDSSVAVLSLPHTDFVTGGVCPAKEITALAHKRGVMVNLDLCHSAGAVPVDLHGWNVDTAEFCSYKFLCGGPGANGLLYVRSDLISRLDNPIKGWWGRKDQFGFGAGHVPDPTLKRFLTGTTNILSMAPIAVGAAIIREATMPAIREKSVKQTEYLIALWREYLAPLGFTLESPKETALRGSQVSLGHKNAWQISQALIDKLGVLPDFRPPIVLRCGLALYTSYAEIFDAVQRIRTAVESRLFTKYSADRGTKVT
jgi:kynureninase